MASEYRTYLATNILNDDRVITYRLLSRALNVHVNTAKEMLYEFHRQQNGKKPGSIHATYLVAGSRTQENHVPSNGHTLKEDIDMPSSPFRSSPAPRPSELMEDTPTLAITLVREEELAELRTSYESITAIHVYSLGPSLLKDLQVLSDASREIVEVYTTQDPLTTASTYGTIINKGVHRRTGRRPVAAAAPPAPKPPVKATPPAPKEEPKPAAPPSKPDAKPSTQSATAKDFFSKSTSKKSTPASTSTNASTPAAAPAATASLKRKSSGIMAAFGKAKPKLKHENTDTSSADVSAAASPAADSPMLDVSEDEEDSYVPPVVDKEKIDEGRKARKEREAALKRMMEDDEEEEDVIEKMEEKAESEDAEDTDVMEIEKPVVKAKAEEQKEYVEVSNGRRRGRRRVMKKKTIKDEEGYLVTREEPAWESFSEDEPVPKKKAPTASSFGSTKGKKPAGKGGQGNIMSFFGKKT